MHTMPHIEHVKCRNAFIDHHTNTGLLSNTAVRSCLGAGANRSSDAVCWPCPAGYFSTATGKSRKPASLQLGEGVRSREMEVVRKSDSKTSLGSNGKKGTRYEEAIVRML